MRRRIFSRVFSAWLLVIYLVLVGGAGSVEAKWFELNAENQIASPQQPHQEVVFSWQDLWSTLSKWWARSSVLIDPIG